MPMKKLKTALTTGRRKSGTLNGTVAGVEVTADLIARCICPADLLQHPCPFDEFKGGCTMVRLCKVSSPLSPQKGKSL